MREQDYSADGVVLVDTEHGLVHCLQLEGYKIGVGFPVNCRVQSFRTNEEHLAHFFAEGHLVDIEGGRFVSGTAFG